MKIEYYQGRRLSKLVHEMDALEAAIYNYDQIASRTLSRYERLAKADSKKSTKTEIEREAELKECLRFLKLERLKLEAIVDVQSRLAAYRDSALAATRGTAKDKNVAIRRLSAENHHPTGDIEAFMMAEGVPKPSSKHTAHHIVPGKGKDPLVNGRTRLHLHRHGIGITDPANGVYLVSSDEFAPHWSMPLSRGHKKYHTKLYETWVANRVRGLSNIDHIKSQLQLIGRILQQKTSQELSNK